MANNEHNQEVVQLIIDAKNLSSDELVQAAEQLRNLGNTARKAEQNLQQIEVKQGTISSFQSLKQQLTQARTELAKAEVEFKNLTVSVKNNKKATDEQKQSVELAKLSLKQQRKELNNLQKAYDNSKAELKQFGAHTKNLTQVSEQLGQAHKNQKQEVERLNAELSKQTQSVAKRIESEKRLLGVTGELTEETRKQIEADRQAAEQKEKQEAAARYLTLSLKKYERQLEQLNRDKQNGVITSGQYIKKEEQLRSQLGLTSAQVSTSRRAVEVDSVSKDKAAKSTDGLTKATRRLAQIYTVLIAAQSAIEVVRQSTQAYGESEAAITKVEKTTGQAREVIAAMHEELAVLSQEIMPTSTNELARFAEIAGQLGTKSTTDILDLVAAADALNVSTNLAGDEAATLLSRILSMTGEGIPQINNLASSVVTLGNNFAVTEDEIAFMTKEIVTGTSAIKVGSAAAAAYGTVLKESGQQAERSRSGFTRLSQSILQAVQKGGSALERLQELTGLTAQEIEKNLGERPEEVLFSLVKGLANAKSEGVLLSNIMRDLGIDSQETLEVFEVLTNKVSRLRYALDLSGKAYVDSTAHFEEAAKVYANQESQIARLINQFTGLKRAAGEAFSDELDQGVRTTSELLTSLEPVVTMLMNGMGDLSEGVSEVVESFGLAYDVISDVGGSAIGAVLAVQVANVRILFNSLTLVIKGFAFTLNEAKIAIAEFAGVSGEKLEAMRETSKKIVSGIQEDFRDIGHAADRIFDESSAAYEDFLSVYEKYKNASTELGEEQQKQIQTLISANKYLADNEQAYIELAAALVRANREAEIRTRMIALQNKRDEERAKLEREEIARNKALREEAERLNLNRKELTEKSEELRTEFEKGTISIADYEAKTKLLLFAEERLNEQSSKLVLTQQIQVAQNEQLSDTVRGLKLSEIDLEHAIWELDNQLNKNIKTDSEKLKLTLQRINAERELQLVKERLRVQTELETKTNFELQVIAEKNTRQIELLTEKYRQGTITFGEYQTKLDTLKVTQSLLKNAVVAETTATQSNTEATQRATSAVNSFTQAKDRSTQSVRNSIRWNRESAESFNQYSKAVQNSTRYTSIFAKSSAQLSKQTDLSNQSTESLQARYDELQGTIVENGRVSSSWWVDLARESNKVFQQEQKVISQTLHMRKLTEQVRSGSKSLSELNKLASNASRQFNNLDYSDLTAYLREIENAKRTLSQRAQQSVAIPSPTSISPVIRQQAQAVSEVITVRFESPSGAQAELAMQNRSMLDSLIQILRESGLRVQI